MELHLQALPGRLAVCRLPANAEVPSWALTARFASITRTEDELSVVCPEGSVPETGTDPQIECVEEGWRVLKVRGPLDFSLTGVLAALSAPLAEAGIPIFALSTFDTDYLLVKAERLEQALEALRAVRHRVEA